MNVLQGMKETALCRLTHDAKAETLLGKCPGPFPCSVLTIAYHCVQLSIFPSFVQC